MSDLKNRKRVNVTLANDFYEWLLEKTEKTGTPFSRIIEMATIEKYRDEYEEFLKNRKKGGDGK